MGQRGPYLRDRQGGGFSYWCQGCEEVHAVGPGWTFNGNFDAPTFSPSVLTTGGYLQRSITVGGIERHEVVHDASGKPIPLRCHTFITDGRVQFLADCSHALAGQTLPLPELPDWLKDPT